MPPFGRWRQGIKGLSQLGDQKQPKLRSPNGRFQGDDLGWKVDEKRLALPVGGCTHAFNPSTRKTKAEDLCDSEAIRARTARSIQSYPVSKKQN